MRIVKRHLPRVKVTEWPSWRKIPQDAPRTPTQTETLLGQPLPSSPCCENLNGPTTEHNMGSTPGNWAGGLHFIFHALSSWFLRRAFSSPFILLIFWMFRRRKAPWQLKLPCTCQSKREGSLWDILYSGMLTRCSRWGRGMRAQL